MTWIIVQAIAFVSGIGLGAIHFGSLWWTVRHLPSRERPGLWLIGTTAMRFAVTLPLLFLLLWQGWQSLAAGLVGFYVMRIIAVRSVRIDR